MAARNDKPRAGRRQTAPGDNGQQNDHHISARKAARLDAIRQRTYAADRTADGSDATSGHIALLDL
eukprot:3266040-Lingulodinium_polyedra.AAC.1